MAMTDKSPASDARLTGGLALIGQAVAGHADVQVGRPPHGDEHALWATLRPLAADSGERASVRLRLSRSSAPSRRRRSVTEVRVLADVEGRRELESLRRANANFIDLESRAVRLSIPGLLIDRILPAEADDASESSPRSGADPFADRASSVVRVLLRDALSPTPRTWGVRELAATCHVDRTTTSEVLRQLHEWKLVSSERNASLRGRPVSARVIDVASLIDRWSASYDWTMNRRLAVHAPIGNVDRFLARLPALLRGRRWALALQAAASRIAPHAAWDRVHVYVDARSAHQVRAVATERDWEPGDDGRLVLMAPSYEKSLWPGITRLGRLPVVGIEQLLIDLWRYPVRGREQAEHLLAMRGALPRELFVCRWEEPA
jgi:hypothetical protein